MRIREGECLRNSVRKIRFATRPVTRRANFRTLRSTVSTAGTPSFGLPANSFFSATRIFETLRSAVRTARKRRMNGWRRSPLPKMPASNSELRSPSTAHVAVHIRRFPSIRRRAGRFYVEAVSLSKILASSDRIPDLINKNRKKAYLFQNRQLRVSGRPRPHSDRFAPRYPNLSFVI